MGNIFKGFKQVKEGASFENGYIYFVRNESNSGATDGYIYFNGKKYGTGEEVRDFIGSLPSGSGDTVIDYIQNLGIDLANQIGVEETARDEADTTLQTNINNLSSATVTAIGRIDDLDASAHTHSNKALLDTYNQTEANLADAVAKKHEHGNKTVLDGITADQVSAWDSAEENANAYTNSSLTAYATSADTVSALETLSGNTTVTVVTGGSSESILKSYTIKQGGSDVATIDIPKDLVVTGGEITVIEGVKYLQLTIANSDQKVNIPVSDLCDVYTGDNTTIEVKSGNVISVKDYVFDASGAAATAKSEAITAATDYTDTKIRDLSGATVSALSAETSARTAADSTLQGNITAEATARAAAVTALETADTNLNNAITAETSARTAAVSALTTRIDALERLTGSTDSALQSISNTDGSITVGDKVNNNQTVAVNILQDNDNALSLKDGGLFAAIYYDGDDVD